MKFIVKIYSIIFDFKCAERELQCNTISLNCTFIERIFQFSSLLMFASFAHLFVLYNFIKIIKSCHITLQ